MTAEKPSKPASKAASSQSKNADVASLSYEAARDELMKVVSQLENGSATLEESLELWERGEALASACEAWLSGARTRLDQALAVKRSE